MKKILTLFISFFVFFSASLNLYAFCVDNVNLSAFDDFALEQVQKVFGSNLSKDVSDSAQKNNNGTAQTENFLGSDSFVCVCPGVSNNITNCKIVYFFKANKDLNYNRYNTENERMLLNCFSGLSEYRIRLNKYIAITIPNDTLNFINKNIMC